MFDLVIYLILLLINVIIGRKYILYTIPEYCKINYILVYDVELKMSRKIASSDYLPGGIYQKLPIPGYLEPHDGIDNDVESDFVLLIEAEQVLMNAATESFGARCEYISHEADSKTKKTSANKKAKNKFVKDVMRSLESIVAAADKKDLEQLSFVFSPEILEEDPEDDDSERTTRASDVPSDVASSSLWILELENLKLLYERRQALLEHSLTSTQVADLLGWQHHKTANDRLKANRIVGVKDRGVYKFPLWQFDPSGEDGIVDGLPELLSRLNISNFRKINWLSKPMAAFDNLTPIEVLKKGNRDDLDDLLIEADGVGVAQ